MLTVPCHTRQSCSTVSDLFRVSKKTKTDMRADAICATRPTTKALSKLLDMHEDYPFFYVGPIAGLPHEYTLLGASGMDMEDVDRLVAEAEAEAAATAEERLAKRTARRDAELVKLEAEAE
eukprot:4032303-Prymnesium_polylepis.1